MQVRASWRDFAYTTGITLWKDAHENDDEEFKNVFEVNTFGPFYLARGLVRSWLDLPIPVTGTASDGSVDVPKASLNLGKQILFVSSISGLVAMTPQRQTAYNASKGALTMMAKSLAAEWAHLGIYVNSISPGYVQTDMIASDTTGMANNWRSRTPVGHFATPEQIGEFVAVLLSEKQGGMGFMTGTDVVLDGGYTLF
jgi:NAD(P)-dependent dehydrogenase (short-subunit alcohol dehydrogenase family)